MWRPFSGRLAASADWVGIPLQGHYYEGTTSKALLVAGETVDALFAARFHLKPGALVVLTLKATLTRTTSTQTQTQTQTQTNPRTQIRTQTKNGTHTKGRARARAQAGGLMRMWSLCASCGCGPCMHVASRFATQQLVVVVVVISSSSSSSSSSRI